MVSPLDRVELERLDRETLIARAEQAGVSRAGILTRPELIDELLLRGAKKDDPRIARARGFFGKARDLLARVIEQGLHLPDAADRLRRMTALPPRRRNAPAAIPTVTLAEIYATQGHRGRAIETLKRVLEHESDHAAARALLTRLSDEATAAPSAVLSDAPSSDALPPPGTLPSDTPPFEIPPSEAGGAESTARETAPEPQGFLDDDTLPGRYDVDECVAVPVDPTTMFAYWEIRESTFAHMRRKFPDGHVALRVLVITPSWEGPLSTTTDLDVGVSLGDWFIRNLPSGAIVRVAVGWRRGDGFTPIAHCPALETPPASASSIVADTFFAWSPGGMVRIEEAGAAAYLSKVRGRGQKDVASRRPGGTASPPHGPRAGGHFEADPKPHPEALGSSEHAYA
jgi:hypothetical protein